MKEAILDRQILLWPPLFRKGWEMFRAFSENWSGVCVCVCCVFSAEMGVVEKILLQKAKPFS